MKHLPNILSLLRIVGAVALLLSNVSSSPLALPSSVTKGYGLASFARESWPSPSELGWLSLLRPFVSIIPIIIVASVATYAAIQEGYFIRRNTPRQTGRWHKLKIIPYFLT